MKSPTYELERIAALLNTGIFSLEGEQLTSFQDHPEANPIFISKELRNFLVEGARKQKIPFIRRDQKEVYFCCINRADGYFLIGPFCTQAFSRLELHRYYHFYGVAEAQEKRLKRFTVTEMLNLIEILGVILLEKQFTDEELIYENHIAKETKVQEKQEQIIFDLKEEEEELYHHTYQEERKLLDSVCDGRVEDALRYSRNMDTDLGKLSTKEFNHWKNAAIVGITLCTRAAIDGGISPSIGYRISDFYIQKSDGCNDVAQIIQYRDHAVEELTRQVQRKKNRKTSSSVERCKNYVDQHYREKIYLADIGNKLDLSESYLSHLFKKETGERLQDYIVRIRLEHAANMLKFSDERISNIAEYVNFPSQSYMGKVFREKYGMTPKQYRNTYQSAEFY